MNSGSDNFALGIEADTGLWLRPVQYERIARAGGNAHIFHHAVIARHEAIARKQSGYAPSPCTVRDCFVPRNDVVAVG